MEIGDSLHIDKLDTGDTAILEDESLTICTVVAPRVLVVAAEEEAEELAELEEEIEPEVITARAGDEGTAGDEE
jgi:hypothetical protein